MNSLHIVMYVKVNVSHKVKKRGTVSVSHMKMGKRFAALRTVILVRLSL